MEVLISLGEVDVDTEPQDDNAQYEQQARPEGHEVVFLAVITPTLTRLGTANIVPGARVKLQADDIGLCCVAHGRLCVGVHIDSVTFPEYNFPQA